MKAKISNLERRIANTFKTNTETDRNRRWTNWRVMGGLALVLLCGGLQSGYAQGISVTVNGDPVQFQDIGPQSIEGRTLVPVRGVLEKLGAQIAFDNATQTVIASTPTIDIQLKIGARTAIVNGKSVTLDVPAQVIRDHTFVPLRFLGEALGADVGWDNASRTVRIITKDALNPSNVTVERPRRDRPDRDGRPREQEDRGPAPAINSFTHNANRWLRAGEVLHVRLDGTPGGIATFRIPGLVEEVPMREEAPGHYTGDWEVSREQKIQLKSAAVIGSLKVGRRSAPLIQAGEMLSVDTRPPRIFDTTPDEKSNTNDPRPNISASFDDDGSGVEPKSVHLLLDGHDVTREATITKTFIAYRPADRLPQGIQQVELHITDRAGNESVARWSFTEAARAQGGITSVSDPANQTFEPGDVVHLEMSGSPGGRAFFNAGNLKNIPMREDKPGHYLVDYTLRRGDDVGSAPVVYRLVTADGEKFEHSSRSVLKVHVGKPDAPIIVSPGPNEPPTNPLVVRGKAMPNTKVRIKIDYRNRVFGVVDLQGTASEVTVTADRAGNWATQPINLGRLPVNRGMEYIISATAINSADMPSETTTTRIKVQ